MEMTVPKVAIWIIGHKQIDYGWYDDNPIYHALQVGNGERFAEHRDSDCPDNISEWNNFYAESTGTYYISKAGLGGDYVGQCQYRRRLHFPADTDFDALFSGCDVICAKPMSIGQTVYEQYAHCHSSEDMETLKAVIDEEFPEMKEAFDKYILKGRKLYYSNSFVLRTQDFKDYADTLFRLLEAFKKRRGYTTPQEVERRVSDEISQGKRRKARGVRYQEQIGGFMSERIWTMWVQWKFAGRILNIDYEKYERV